MQQADCRHHSALRRAATGLHPVLHLHAAAPLSRADLVRDHLGPARVCGTSIAPDLNAGWVKQACDAMVKYVLANGKRLQGLVNRRNDPVWGERPWCLRGLRMAWLASYLGSN